MNILYIDPVHGISGDMMVSALIDAGCPFAVLRNVLSKLPVPVPHIEPETRVRGALAGIYVKIAESVVHLEVREMEAIIRGLATEERVRRDALAMLDIMVEAESKVHGVPREEIHLHELSHVDTLIDVVCVARAVAYFGIDEVYCGTVPHGRGFIRIAHGVLPNPPPATVEILKGFSQKFLDEEMELTTPTGAAIVRHYAGESRPAPAFSVTTTGCGFGTVETAFPNVLRVFIGERATTCADEEVWVLEADMDDAEPEYLGAIADRIRAGGALDVLYFPVYMKKGRPGVRFSVTAPSSLVDGLVAAVLRETTTFGLRMRRDLRSVLRREESVVETSFGRVRVKKGYDRTGTLVKSHIEFEDVKRIADERNLPYRGVLESLKKEL